MSNFHVTFSDNFKEVSPYCHVKVTSDDGTIVLGNYQMTFDDFVESIIDANMKTLKPRRVIGIKKLNSPSKIRGRKKMENTALTFETPILPANCLKYVNRPSTIKEKKRKSEEGIQASLKYKSTEQFVFIEIPKKQMDYYYYNSEMKAVGFPRLIFGYRIVDQRVSSIYIFAVKEDGRIKENTPLYKFPYANVSDSGLVCMGTNPLPLIKDIQQIGTLHNLFFAAPSSACHYYGLRNNSGFNDLRDLYNHMSNNQFPDEWLVSMETSFGEFFKKLMKKAI